MYACVDEVNIMKEIVTTWFGNNKQKVLLKGYILIVKKKQCF